MKDLDLLKVNDKDKSRMLMGFYLGVFLVDFG